VKRWSQHTAEMDVQDHAALMTALLDGLNAARRSAQVAASDGQVQEARAYISNAIENLQRALDLLSRPPQ